MSLPVTRRVRQQLGLDARRFGESGKLSLTSFASAYALADALREREDPGGEETRPITGEELAALDLLEDLAQEAVEELIAELDPDFFERCLRSFEERLGAEGAAARWRRLADELQIAPADASDQGACLRELLGSTLVRRHPLADRILGQLGLDEATDPELEETLDQIDALLGEERSMLGEALRLPIETLADVEPSSFDEVLATLSQWPGPWDDDERQRIDAVLGLLAEARAPRLPPGDAPMAGIGLDGGPAAYSEDAPWMPNLVLVAKNALVWLDQLSKRHGHAISRLDEIPDEELDRLVARGMTGLWLIGVWERSPASAEIKRRQGIENAAPSAYSVRRYRIAEELGGEEALESLKERALRFGLRLAADFVPNHMAIDSDWVIEHPERFLQRPESPFPGYLFEGPDLSPDARVRLQIEDHYFDRTDAAVVFRRVDLASGGERFLYHGNDGTSIPWNDTAQLDYLNPEVREAVVDEIVAVAKRFPILRFDAAMTLTRQHFHRLWYPESSAAGAIPSRAEQGLSAEEFARRMPDEFWREVVDRLAEGAPDTLLLAEAFWLMEGYFVRRLGLHRVYNSAFMHMLRDGATGQLRRLLQETIDIDPKLLGRFANYLSSPDEETAVAQFGRDDRYFGACRVLATLPGLPMFTHGQWEGLTEKYGMEFRRARRDESPDEEILARHEREIAPLLRQRARFAGVEEFRLLEMVDDAGKTLDQVLAYANNSGHETVVVAFNNSAEATAGRLVRGDAWLDDSIRELRHLTGDGGILIAAENHGERRISLALGPYECVVLGSDTRAETTGGR